VPSAERELARLGGAAAGASSPVATVPASNHPPALGHNVQGPNRLARMDAADWRNPVEWRKITGDEHTGRDIVYQTERSGAFNLTKLGDWLSDNEGCVKVASTLRFHLDMMMVSR
jgi:hypothetical protein